MTVKELIQNVEDLKVHLNEISVYDLDVHTSMDLYYTIAKKFNVVIKELSRFEGVVSNEVIKQNEKLVYLLGEGLNAEVVKKINQMVSDGTMDTIINHKLFNSVNNKIEDIEQEIDVERKRIDSFTRLAEGSTTGDAELIDARVGADGIRYSCLGDSIRSQLNYKLDRNDLNKTNIKLNNPITIDWENGTYSGSLTPTTNTKRIRSKKISVIKNETYKITFNSDYTVRYYSSSSTSFYEIKSGDYLNTCGQNFINTDSNSLMCEENIYFVVSKKVDGVEQEISINDVSLLNFEMIPQYKNNNIINMIGTNKGNIFKNLNFEKGKTYNFNILFDESTSNSLYIILNKDPNYVDDDEHKKIILNGSKKSYNGNVTMTDNYKSVKIFLSTAVENSINVSEVTNNLKTESIDYTLVQKVMNGSGNYIDSNLGVSVENKINTVIGDRYRFSVNNGYVIVINKDSNNYKFATNMLEVVADKESYGLTIQRDDKSELYITDIDAIGLKIEHVINKNTSGTYDCIVAANNSSYEDKKIADLICDGVNDEVEIECAINCNVTTSNSARVLLLPGDYNIDRFREVKNLNNNLNAKGNVAILTQKSLVNNGRYEVIIEGRYPCHLSKNSATRIIVSKSCQQSLINDKNKEYTIFGALRNDPLDVNGSMFDMFALQMNNIFLSPNGLDKPIICIDGIGYGQLMVSNCGISWNIVEGNDLLVYFDVNSPVDGLIGIRGCYGSNRGCKNYIKNTTIIGMHEGIALLGEHFIVEDCLQHHCYYGFTIGNYDVRREMEHPNIFIGNSMEQCYRFALLNRFGATTESTVEKGLQTLIYIGGSTEPSYTNSDGSSTSTLPIKEIIKGAYRGRFETDFGNKPLFEGDGSGKNMIITKY